jgi:protein TonB
MPLPRVLLAVAMFALVPSHAFAQATAPAAAEPDSQNIAAIVREPPAFPTEAIRACASGTTRVRVRIDDQGRVRKVALEETSGNEDLDASAIKSVKLWMFRPATTNGVPRGGEVIVPLVFADPCPMELEVDDPLADALPPPGWDSKASPLGWEPYEDTSGRTRRPPQYPKAALQACAGGVARVRVVVSALSGFVKSTRLEESSGNAALDAEAVEAARHWLYRPGKRGELVVGGDVIVPVHFKAPC